MSKMVSGTLKSISGMSKMVSGTLKSFAGMSYKAPEAASMHTNVSLMVAGV
jgi:hypothetical protein